MDKFINPTSHRPNGAINYLRAWIYERWIKKHNQQMLGCRFCARRALDFREIAYLVGPGICKRVKNMLICEPISQVLLTRTETNLWQVSSDCELWRLKLRQRIISSVVLWRRKPRAIKISSVVLDCRLIAWGRGAHSMAALGFRPGLGSLKFENQVDLKLKTLLLIGRIISTGSCSNCSTRVSVVS